MNIDTKTCGDCKFFISHKKNKYGFNGNCKEIVIREEQTNIMSQINITKEDKACTYFEPKVQK